MYLRRLFWDVSEGSLRCLSQWRSLWDISKTSHAGWVTISNINFLKKEIVSVELLIAAEYIMRKAKNLLFLFA